MSARTRSAPVSDALSAGSSWWALVERRAEVTPERTMLDDDRGRSLTFSDYRLLCEEVAAGLAELGVGAGQVVSWQLPTTVEAVVLMGALARLGVAQNPIIPILRRAEVGLIVEQLDSDVLVVPGTWRGFDYAAMADEAVGDRDCRVLACSDFASSHGQVALPRADPAGLPRASEPAGDVQWYYYTSGTTAVPKGAKHTDASILASSAGFVQHLQLGPDDVFPMAYPFAHVGGVLFLSAQLRVGARLLMLDSFDPVESPLLMAEYGATLLGSAVPFFRAYLAAQDRHGSEPLFPRLRACVAGGAPMPPELHVEIREKLGGLGVINAWGMTEFLHATMLAVDDPPEKFLGSVGLPLPHVDVRVFDLDGTELPTGQEGELRLHGPQRCAGFVDPDLDREAFDSQGFLRTGDLGVIDSDGYVQVTGRLKDIIIRNAENISAPEVEGVLARHPAIAEVAVLGLPDERTGERCCAVVVLAEGAVGLTLHDLAAHCDAQGLARQKIPEQLELVSELPRHPMGKVLKHQLRAQLLGSRS